MEVATAEGKWIKFSEGLLAEELPQEGRRKCSQEYLESLAAANPPASAYLLVVFSYSIHSRHFIQME